MEISLEDGKYIYRCADSGAQTVHRHGEPWRDITGDKFIYCMAAKIEELRSENAALKAELSEQKEAFTIQGMTVTNLQQQLSIAQQRNSKLSEELEATLARAEEQTIKKCDALQDELAAAQATIEQIPKETIAECLADLMDVYVKNGANSVSMPDECVEVAYWLANIPTNQDALYEALARECERLVEVSKDYHLRTWLRNEAAAHRARKERK